MQIWSDREGKRNKTRGEVFQIPALVEGLSIGQLFPTCN